MPTRAPTAERQRPTVATSDPVVPYYRPLWRPAVVQGTEGAHNGLLLQAVLVLCGTRQRVSAKIHGVSTGEILWALHLPDRSGVRRFSGIARGVNLAILAVEQKIAALS